MNATFAWQLSETRDFHVVLYIQEWGTISFFVFSCVIFKVTPKQTPKNKQKHFITILLHNDFCSLVSFITEPRWQKYTSSKIWYDFPPPANKRIVTFDGDILKKMFKMAIRQAILVTSTRNPHLVINAVLYVVFMYTWSNHKWEELWKKWSAVEVEVTSI